MGTDAATQPLFQGANAAQSKTRLAGRKSAKCWTYDENQFVDWLMRTWNETMAAVSSRAYNKRHNRYLAIDFYRRNCARGDGERFTEDMIRRGLIAYSECEVNRKVGWRSFPDFMPLAEEILEKQLKRIGYKAPPPPDPKRDAVAPLLTHLALGQLSDQCTATASELFDHIKSFKSPKRAGPFDADNLRYYEKLKGLVDRLRALNLSDRRSLAARASDAFQDFYSVKYDANMLIRRNRRRAIALALFDLDPNRAREKAEVPP